MRIVQLVGWYYPDGVGGTEVYVAALAKYLRAQGHDVTIAAPDPTCAHDRTYEHDGVPVYRYPIPAAATRDEAQGLVPVRGAEHFAAWLRRQRPDVVHAHAFVTGIGLWELRMAREAGARVVATCHSGGLGWICQRGTMLRWGAALCDGITVPTKCAACSLQQRGVPKVIASVLAATPTRLSRMARRIPGKIGTTLSMRDLIARNVSMQATMLDLVDHLVVLTRWAFDTVVANGGRGEKVTLNRLGQSWSTVMRKPGPDVRPTKPPIRIGYLGRFDPIKGVFDLARATRALPADVPIEVEFRGPLRTATDRDVVAELQRLAGGDARVTVAEEVVPAGVVEVLRAYDVLCCPPVCLEGGPTVAIEAHAVGTPVIGTRIGGLAELITDGVNGRLVPPGDWRQLASVLEEIAVDPHNTVDRWRRTLPPARSMSDVAEDYLRLYAPRKEAVPA